MASCGRPSLPFARPYTLKTLKTPLGIAQATGTPRPHQWLLVGVQACLLPGLTPLKRLKLRLACLIPQPTGTPRPHQWLLMGVQACRLPGLKRLKGLKPLKLCKSVSERPTGAGKSYPKATSMASSGRSSLPFARRYTLEILQTL